MTGSAIWRLLRHIGGRYYHRTLFHLRPWDAHGGPPAVPRSRRRMRAPGWGVLIRQTRVEYDATLPPPAGHAGDHAAAAHEHRRLPAAAPPRGRGYVGGLPGVRRGALLPGCGQSAPGRPG